MKMISYDKTFAGFLSAIFDIYEYRLKDVRFSGSDDSLFDGTHFVTTIDIKSARVWRGITRYLSPGAASKISTSFLSEVDGIEDTLYQYIQYVFASKGACEADYSNQVVLAISQIAKKVHREKHRMEAFVRFKLASDSLCYSIVEPDFNVLPLILPHFQRRYSHQRWMIYDGKRKYGIYYDLEQVTRVTVHFDETNCANTFLHDEKEELYQDLWKNYFSSVNIPSRRNMKLHMRHMPFRYWKFLTEKQ